MPDDDLTKTLLSEYEATADALQHGLNVSVETMNKYHGMTGKLLVQTVRNLWSQQELDEQIDQRVAERCSKCSNSQVNAAFSLGGFVMKYGRAAIWAVAAVLIFGLLTGNLDELGQFCQGWRGEVIQYGP